MPIRSDSDKYHLIISEEKIKIYPYRRVELADGRVRPAHLRPRNNERGSVSRSIANHQQEEKTIATKGRAFTRVNEGIRVPKVRLIDAEGRQIGIVDTRRALEMAEEADLDLVEVAPDARPPVCRIIDYGKYRYDKEKKAKEARRKQHNVQMKQIRFAGANISEHDLEYRMAHIREFLAKGNRVKVSVRFRGRQMAYQDRGREILLDLAQKLEDVAVVDQEPKMEGREMSLILRPS